jgi:4a-hydroxytetrahydrobiopterin dehydratase
MHLLIQQREGAAMNLTTKQCVPCEGGVPALDADQVITMISHLSGWRVEGSAGELRKQFKFAGFRQTMAFVDRLAELAEAEGHHPDFCVRYDTLDVVLTTHAISGLSENDFIVAAKIDQLV